MPFIENEFRAVKAKLIGLTVRDETSQAGGTPVAVRFRQPQQEMAENTYPMIIIDPKGFKKADDREHRGWTTVPYWFEGSDPADAPAFDPERDVNSSPYYSEYPIPFDFDFQITVYCRLQSHLLQLMSRLSETDMIPARFGYVKVPQDNTVRNLELVGGPETSSAKDTDGKRTFYVTYLIRIPGEMFPYEQPILAKLIESVDVSIEDIVDPTVTI